MEPRRLVQSFNYAFDGLRYALRTQQNMRIHLLLGTLVMLLALALGVSRLELLILILTISVVLVAEMINTAIETVVDMFTRSYHPLAEVAKNVAAGAVVIAAAMSVIVGYLVLLEPLSRGHTAALQALVHNPLYITLLGVTATVLIVLGAKVKKGEGTVFHGGMPSGHSAVAFGIATAIFFLSRVGPVTVLAFILAFLVAQSRVEGRIHSFLQVAAGAVLGIFVTAVVFRLLA